MSNVMVGYIGGDGKYKGDWQPNTIYNQYDLVYESGSLWVANSTFTSGGAFSDSNWVCPDCPTQPPNFMLNLVEGYQQPNAIELNLINPYFIV